MGTFEVPVRLHPEVSAQISVIVHADGADPISEFEEDQDDLDSTAELQEIESSEENEDQIDTDSNSNIETDDQEIS